MRRRDDTSAESTPVEPRQVESFLEELLLLCQRSEEYTQYMLARMGEVAGAGGPGAAPAARETALRGGGFSSAVRELLSYYLALEEYYMEESVAKVGGGWGHGWGEGRAGGFGGAWRRAWPRRERGPWVGQGGRAGGFQRGGGLLKVVRGEMFCLAVC